MAPKITIKSEDGLISTYTLIKPDNIYIKEASCPEYVMSFGSTCVVYLAETSNGRKRLIKEFLEKHDTTHEHSILNEIINCHSKDGKNYFSQDDFFGEDEMGKNYHVFPAFEGDIIRPYVVSNEKEFIAVLREYKRFLCHLEDVHKSFLHWDIKASNVFRFASHDDSLGEYIWELIDFDVSCKIDDTAVYGHGTCRPTSPEWYTDKDLIAYNKLNSDQLADCKFVLDITAAAKLLSYSICGNTQYRRTDFITSYEGYCSALARIFRKAFNQDLTRRYKSATELKDDIQAIIEAYDEKQFSSAMAWNIREMNTSPLKKMYQANSLYEVKNNKIDPGILTDIKCDELEPELFSFDEDKGSALEQLCLSTNKNIWLRGEAGSGKSTTLHQYCLSTLQKHFSDTIVVYKKLSKCEEFGEDYSTIELDKIVDTSKIIDLRSPVVILLDAYDEIEKRRSLESQQEQEKFDAAFIEALYKAPSNFRFIITSRFLPEVVRESKMFISTTNQRLRDKNIYEYLQIDYDDIDRINENKALLELLRNPFCLTLFSALREENANIAYEITTEAELIENYLWSTYKSKAGDKQNRKSFNRFIYEIAGIALSNVYVDEEAYENIYDKPIIHYFNNTIDLKPIKHSKYKILFAHELIREWFVAYGMRNKFLKTSAEEMLTEGFDLLDSRYSYNILLLFSQMILSSPFENENSRNKMMLSKIAGNYQLIIDNRNKKEQERLVEKGKMLHAQGLPQKTIRRRLAAESISLEDNGHFPSNLLQIVAFAYGGDLSSFDFGKITCVDFMNFASCNIIRAIKLPNTFYKIEVSAFMGCENLEKVILPESIMNIGAFAFEKCKKLKEINIPDKIKEIDSGVFCDCESITDISLPEKLTRIGQHAFWGCKNLQQIDIPDAIKEIENGVFVNCECLREVSLSKGLIRIGKGSFLGCKKLSQINIPKNVVEIGDKAFYGCESLTELCLPMGLTCIGTSSINHCYNIQVVKIPRTVKCLGNTIFFGCFKLQNILYEGTKNDWENIIKIAPEGELWSIGNDYQRLGLNHKIPIKIQCLDGIIEY